MQITTWRFEESPRPEAAWKQADGGLLHVDTWGQTRPPLGVQDGGGCALDSWKIHEKWQKLSSYKDFSVTETIHCLTLGVIFSKRSYRKNLDQMFGFPMVHCESVQLLYLLYLVLAVNVLLKRANRIIPHVTVLLKRAISFKSYMWGGWYTMAALNLALYVQMCAVCSNGSSFCLAKLRFFLPPHPLYSLSPSLASGYIQPELPALANIMQEKERKKARGWVKMQRHLLWALSDWNFL